MLESFEISRLTTHPVRYAEPNDANGIRYLLFVRVESTCGAVGWGEAITQFPGSTRAAEALVHDFADLVVGKDPVQNLGIVRDLYKQSWWYSYRGGSAHFAISAIDIALWDLRGRLTNQSLSQMIGSRDAQATN